MSVSLLQRVSQHLSDAGLLAGYDVVYLKWTDQRIAENKPFALFRLAGTEGVSNYCVQYPDVRILLVGLPTTAVDTLEDMAAIIDHFRQSFIESGDNAASFEPIGPIIGPLYLENGRPVLEITVRCMAEDAYLPRPEAPVVVSCAYPLDASAAELQAIGLDGVLALSADQQTGDYVVQSGLGALEEYGAAPAGIGGPSPATLDFARAGTVAIEFQIPAFPAVGGAAPSMRANINLLTPTFSEAYTVRVLCDGVTGLFSIRTDNGLGDVLIASNLLSAPASLALVSDGVNIYVRYNGANYAATPWTPKALACLQSVTEHAGVPGGDAGKTVAIRAETNAANFLGSYESGTTDPCGNAI